MSRVSSRTSSARRSAACGENGLPHQLFEDAFPFLFAFAVLALLLFEVTLLLELAPL